MTTPGLIRELRNLASSIEELSEKIQRDPSNVPTHLWEHKMELLAALLLTILPGVLCTGLLMRLLTAPTG